MFDTSMTYNFDGVAHDEKAPEGPNRGDRFATNWTVGKERFRVSSVDNSNARETMIFRIEEDGSVNYFDLWAEKIFYSNASQHAKFFQEFLENRGPND
tara:strand:- start:562 stop:855 length:294 start_codon:yes stop_codon:yes gene_type:complete